MSLLGMNQQRMFLPGYMFKKKIILYRDDILKISEKYILSNKHPTFSWLPLIVRDLVHKKISEIVPKNIEVIISIKNRKAPIK